MMVSGYPEEFRAGIITVRWSAMRDYWQPVEEVRGHYIDLVIGNNKTDKKQRCWKESHIIICNNLGIPPILWLRNTWTALIIIVLSSIYFCVYFPQTGVILEAKCPIIEFLHVSKCCPARPFSSAASQHFNLIKCLKGQKSKVSLDLCGIMWQYRYNTSVTWW